jgi:hypothetical protein
MQKLADITKVFIISGNIQRVKKCLDIATRLYSNGNNEVKNAIANVYVFSVSTFMEIHHYNIRKLFPKPLQSEYLKQVNASGI